jgi:endonuclease-8
VPEGDAVLRTARRLDAALAGRRLLDAELRWPTVAGIDLRGKLVLGTGTHGKHLLTRFDDGRTLHTHLRMEGSWRTRPTRHGARFGYEARAILVAPEWTAVGLRLGVVEVLRTRDEGELLRHLGPDLLAPGWDRQRAVANLLRQGERPIGECLLDQSVVAGIGTIYLAESLWATQVSPWAAVSDVADPAAVLDTARQLMQRSVAARRPTATGDERPGRQSNAYAREGFPCPRCGTLIKRDAVGQAPRARSAYFCPTCQPRPNSGRRSLRPAASADGREVAADRGGELRRDRVGDRDPLGDRDAVTDLAEDERERQAQRRADRGEQL